MVPILLVLLLIPCFQADPDAGSMLECFEQEAVTSEELFELDDRNPNLIEGVPKLKCFAACILESVGLLENCTFSDEKIEELTATGENDTLLQNVAACKDSATGDERCECGYNLFLCLTANEDKVKTRKH